MRLVDRVVIGIFAFAPILAGSIAHAGGGTKPAPNTPAYRQAAAQARLAAKLHPQGAALLADSSLNQLELANGAKVLVKFHSYVEQGNPRDPNDHPRRVYEFQAYGKLGDGNASVHYLSPKERAEVTTILDGAQAQHRHGFRISVQQPPKDAFKSALDARLSTHEERNALLLKKILE